MTSLPTFEGDPCKKCQSTTRFVNGSRQCVACKKAARKRCNDKNRERYSAYPRGPRDRSKDKKVNAAHRKLGVSEERYAEMLSTQDGRCAVCRKKWRRKLYVDHCHGSNRVRGLLCGRCNTAIGFLGDSVEGVMRAVRYLQTEKDPAQGVEA